MNKTRTVHAYINKWVMLTAAGLVSAVAGLGVFASHNQQTLDATTIPEISLPNEAEKPEDLVSSDIPEIVNTDTQEKVTETPEVQEKDASKAVAITKDVTVPAMPTNSSTPQQISQQKVEDKYPVDQKYLDGVASWSMAAQYKDYVVLAPAGADIWKEKAEKLRKMAEQEPWQGINTSWQGYLYAAQINADRVHKICSRALSHSWWNIWGRVMFTYRSHFDLLWDICGRDDKVRPSGW